jgi:hypothetical protein
MGKYPKASGKYPKIPECISYSPNENLAQVIARAWSDASFKEKLLTFSLGTRKADWKKISPQARAAMLRKTGEALGEFDVLIDNAVVLTVEQYASYKMNETEVVFVLPEPLSKQAHRSLATARVAMALHCCGV